MIREFLFKFLDFRENNLTIRVFVLVLLEVTLVIILGFVVRVLGKRFDLGDNWVRVEFLGCNLISDLLGDLFLLLIGVVND
jgi:hypothetical protein